MCLSKKYGFANTSILARYLASCFYARLSFSIYSFICFKSVVLSDKLLYYFKGYCHLFPGNKIHSKLVTLREEESWKTRKGNQI